MRRPICWKLLLRLIAGAALGNFSTGVAQERQSAGVSEVVFIGANHNYTFLHPGFSPAHIRALLSKVGPVALCVELTPDWPRNNGIPTFPQELYAAMTWAEHTGTPVHGVDWATPTRRALPPVVRMDESVRLSASDGAFERCRADYLATVWWTARQSFGEAPNDIEFHQRTSFPLTIDLWPEEDSVAAVRDDRIAENVRLVLARYPGGRVAVVFGGYHYLPLKRRVEAAGRIRVLSPLQYLPLESERTQAGWH